MNPYRRFIDRFSLIGFTILSVLLISAGVAQARIETLRWTHGQASDVASWEAFLGSSSGSYNQTIPLTNVQTGSDGVIQASIEVADSLTVYIAVRAIGNDGQRSALSNERRRDPVGGTQPPPPDNGPTDPGEPVPPASDALVRDDFEDNAPGSSVAGWVDTGSNFSLSQDDSLFRVSNISGNRVLSTSSTASNIHSHRRVTGQGWAEMTLTGRLSTDSSSGALGVTISSAYPNSDVYYRLGRNAGGAYEIIGRPGISCGDPGTGVVPLPGQWYRFEFSVVARSSGNSIRAKIWRQGETAPSSYQADCFDSTSNRPTAGTFGVWSSGSGEKYWDDLEVTTRGGGPPTTTTPPAPPILIQVVPAGS